MPEDKEQQPVLRVEMPDGSVYYPKYEKNTQGNWKVKDEEFWQKALRLQDSKRQSKKDKN